MPSHRLKWFWILLALVLKAALAAVFIWKFTPEHAPHLSLEGLWGQLSNDSAGYLDPVDRFMGSGRLADLFDYRMYGYGLPYLLLRLFLAKVAALNALIVLQVGISAVSVYLLARIGFSLFEREWAFRIAFFGYFLLLFVSHFDVVVLTESLTTSALILSLFFLFRGGGMSDRVLSGAFLGWGIFLRPVLAPLAALWVAWVLLGGARTPAWRRIRECAVLLLPFIVFECTWVAGNRVFHGRWTLLNVSTWDPTFTDARKHTIDLIEFQQAYGGDWYDDWRWYYASDMTLPPPSIPYTSRFNADSIEVLRREMRAVQRDMFTFEPSTPLEARDSINQVVVSKLRAFTRSIEEERRVIYYGVAPARMVRLQMFSSPTSRMFGGYDTMNRVLVVPRLALDVVAWGLLASTAAAFLLLVRNWRAADGRAVLLLLIIGYFVSVHAVVFRLPDPRYLVPVMPLTLLAAMGLWGRLGRRRSAAPGTQHLLPPELEDQ